MRRIASILLAIIACAVTLRADDRPTSQPTTQPDESATTAVTPPDAAATIENAAPTETRNTLNVDALDRVFTDLVDRVAPSVVAIESDRRPSALPDNIPDAASPWVSFGAGVVIRADGRILTCQHLIDGASAIHIILHDGRRIPARKIAEDRRSDLAVIRAEGIELSPAEFASSGPIRRGQWVLAFGDPLGLARDGHLTVADGIVAAVNRPLPPMFGREEDRYYGDLIQTTAPAGPGSSGGPLFSLDGRVIGIVAAMPTRTGDISPYAFAIPITNRTRRIIDALAEGRAIEHGYLGVEVDLLTDAERQRAGVPGGSGVRIEAVFADGPADRAGLRRGDIVLHINDTPIASVDDFVGRIGAHSAGESIHVAILRNRAPQTIDVMLTRRPPNPEQSIPDVVMSFRGAALGRVDETMRAMSNLPADALLVIRVATGSAADRAGLMPGEVIIRADGRALQRDAATQLLSANGNVMLGLADGRSIVVRP